MDKLNAISVFCRVIESQSFTQVAQQMNISVAMVSKLISQLEEQLKTRLLQRTTRKITPTEAGQIYYQRCLSVLMELEEADASIANHNSALQGNLSVSVPREFGMRFITPNLAKFLNAHPHLHVNIEYTDRKVDLISEGYDLALRIGQLTESTLVAKKIASSSMHIVASPHYLAQKGVPTTPEALSQHDCLIYKLNYSLIWALQKNHQHYQAKVNAKFTSNNGLVLVEMAKAGLGIINSPLFFIEQELRSGELVELLTDYQQDTIDIHVVYPHRRYLPAKVRAFIDFLTELKLCQTN
ncbi:DNA-binding transcriptional LysR family regulator [Volucribacter psittacicida]|uniref:DNA-binding transcriptional LysR family regulator n=1 Tax=Volucribacter psittacicida TaxID=203482 RepID=A0A4R1G2F8_9PAST|nr:LysR family transcriptional regulator [Volucribacter psittacicida]TCK01914.1 DNA-binding transcriptional LysR family regulator [Volucribacter psittacicida]